MEVISTKNELNPYAREFDLNNAGLQNQDMTGKSKEVDYSLKLFTEEIAEVIVHDTCKYAQQQKDQNWKDIDISDLYFL